MKIAVVGGGITGSVVASELTRVLGGENSKDRDKGKDNQSKNISEVVLFDQGRRGPGGRASHRSVIKTKQHHHNTSSTSSISNEVVTANGVGVGAGAGAVVENDEFVVLPDDDIDEAAFQFDHGCQFFRADSPKMKDLVENWLRKGWVAPWKARFGCLPENSVSSDFFGIPSPPNGDGNDNVNDNDHGSEDIDDDDNGGNVYIGFGGMHLLPRKILDSSKAVVHRGTRVSGVASRTVETRDGNGNAEKIVWDLTTTVGAAAFHDTKESVAQTELQKAKMEVASDTTSSATSATNATAAETDAKDADTRVVVHRGFDAVVFTDISSSSDSWHRASASIPPTFAAKLPPKLRLPLFSCMIALKTPLKDVLPYDAFCVSKNASDSNSSNKTSPLWFASRSDSKPGFPKSGTDNGNAARATAECWTLISTAAFAVDQIKKTTMRDPETGAFRPQENNYLNSIPGPVLRDAFFDLVRPYLDVDGNSSPMPTVVYLQAQRWGSGLPIDPKTVPPEHAEDICGTSYASSVKGSLVYSMSSSSMLLQTRQSEASSPPPNFVADDDIGLYYGGDFCSHYNPGFEAAALSGFDLATHLLLQKERHDL